MKKIDKYLRENIFLFLHSKDAVVLSLEFMLEESIMVGKTYENKMEH